jgi:hypothetical protein
VPARRMRLRQGGGRPDVEAFIRSKGGDRQRCVKALTFIARIGGWADDLDYLRALADEFQAELRPYAWINRRIKELEGINATTATENTATE